MSVQIRENSCLLSSSPMANNPDPNLSQIRAFRTVGPRLGTAGQPTEAQLGAVRDAGFEAVVNLAMPGASSERSNSCSSRR